MKKSLKVVSILMMAVMMIMVATPVFAANETEEIAKPGIDAGTILSGVTAEDPTSKDGVSDVKGLVERILGFLQWAAIIGGVLIITILGIKYMMGSLEEKAEYKKSLIPLVVGIIVIMGATSIAKLLFSAFVL